MFLVYQLETAAVVPWYKFGNPRPVTMLPVYKILEIIMHDRIVSFVAKCILCQFSSVLERRVAPTWVSSNLRSNYAVSPK